MSQYKLVLNEDINNSIQLESTDPEACYEEALDVLGWTLVSTEEEINNDQLAFEF